MKRAVLLAVLVIGCSGSRQQTKSAGQQGAPPAEAAPVASGAAAQGPAAQPDAGVAPSPGNTPAERAVTPPAARLTGGLGCPAGTAAVFRGYNNAFTAAGKNPWDSNHRFSTVLADILGLVSANNWKNEGEVFCALP